MKSIVVTDTREELLMYINDINHDIKGRQIRLNQTEFNIFWKSGIIGKFYNRTGILIDDFETTIVDNREDILILEEIVTESTFSLFSIGLKKSLALLVNYAIERESTVVFFF